MDCTHGPISQRRSLVGTFIALFALFHTIPGVSKSPTPQRVSKDICVDPYIVSAQRPQSFAERYLLGLPLRDAPPLLEPKSFLDSAANGLSFYQRLQLEDGHWACRYGDCSFLTPGVVFACYITNTPMPSERKAEIKAYIANNLLEDGGWGLCINSETTVGRFQSIFIGCRAVKAFRDIISQFCSGTSTENLNLFVYIRVALSREDTCRLMLTLNPS